MRILVSDTSILIDLERGSFLQAVLGLPFEFAVPDLLYERELRHHGGPQLVKLGLRVEELDADGVALALTYRRRRRALSPPDSFALALASTESWTLLTGDGGLRDLARQEDVDCHSVLWLLDRMFENGVLAGNQLRTGLETLAAHP